MPISGTLKLRGLPLDQEMKTGRSIGRFFVLTWFVVVVAFISISSSKSYFHRSTTLSGRPRSGPTTLSAKRRDDSLLDPDYNNKPGRFLYLVTCEGDPDETWLVLTQQPGVYGMFASWRQPVKVNITSEKLRAFFYPSSTWTTSRNFLFSKVEGFERQLGLRMNFILFADEDLVLKSRAPWDPTVHFANSLAASLQLHRMLMRDQPPRAGVEYATFFPINQYSAECVQSCGIDGALDIYHRSIVDHLMPYTDAWDHANWHVSQLVMNLGCQALLPDSCSLYREVFVDQSKNSHKMYPSDDSLYDKAGKLGHDCLQQRGFHPARTNISMSRQEALLRSIYRPKPGERPEKCVSAPADINYGRQLKKELQLFPKNCLGKLSLGDGKPTPNS